MCNVIMLRGGGHLEGPERRAVGGLTSESARTRTRSESGTVSRCWPIGTETLKILTAVVSNRTSNIKIS